MYAKEAEPEASVYTDKQGIVYALSDDGTCYVSGYTGDLQDTASIPAQIDHAGDSYTVKGISESAFQKCGQLKQLKISNRIADIHAGTFSDCKKLAEIRIIPTKTSIKKTGKTVAVTVKVCGVLAGEADSVKLEVDGHMMEEALSRKSTDTITFLLSAVGSAGYDGDDMPAGAVFLEEAVKMLADSGKNLKLRMKSAKGKNCYMKISAGDLEQVSGKLDLSLQEMAVGDASGNFRTDIKKALQKNGIRTGTIRILDVSIGNSSVKHAGIIIPSEGISGMQAGSKAYVYRYDKKGRALAAVFYHPYTVSKQGNVSMALSKNGIFVVSGKPLEAMGKKLANGFWTESGNTYYIDKAGKAVCGWRKIGEEYYYFDRENGKMSSGCKVDGISLTKAGTAQKTKENVLKIQTMMKARTVVGQVTNASDSKATKIEKCFRWILQFPYRRYRRLQPICRQAGWEVTFANDIFDHHQGCCVSEASALAFLFHECGYKTVYVATDTGHAWVELDGRVYDPLFAEARGFDQYYNVSYASFGLHAVIKRKI